MGVRLAAQAALGAALLASSAGAQASAERAASIIIFPHVVADGSRDTVIQLNNIGNSLVRAKCFYVSRELTPTLQRSAPANPIEIQVTAFEIVLTVQQPTHWVASRGRLVDPQDPACQVTPACEPENIECDGAGLDPGVVPALGASSFQGALLCVETGFDGHPVSGNHFTGIATITQAANGSANQYSAIGLPGNDNNDGDDRLCLGGEVSAECPFGGEYDPCPDTWFLHHFPQGAEDSLLGAGSSVETSLTFIGCSMDLQAQTSQVVPLSIIAAASTGNVVASASIEGLEQRSLTDLSQGFGVAALGSAAVVTRFSSTAAGGILVAAEHIYRAQDPARGVHLASSNLHHEGAAGPPGVIILPAPP